MGLQSKQGPDLSYTAVHIQLHKAWSVSAASCLQLFMKKMLLEPWDFPLQRLILNCCEVKEQRQGWILHLKAWKHDTDHKPHMLHSQTVRDRDFVSAVTPLCPISESLHGHRPEVRSDRCQRSCQRSGGGLDVGRSVRSGVIVSWQQSPREQEAAVLFTGRETTVIRNLLACCQSFTGAGGWTSSHSVYYSLHMKHRHCGATLQINTLTAGNGSRAPLQV